MQAWLRRFFSFSFLQVFRLEGPIWILFLHARGLSLSAVGLTEVAYHLAGLAGQVPSGVFADRRGRHVAMSLGSALQVAGLVVLLGVRGPFQACGGMALLGLGGAFVSGADRGLLYGALSGAGMAGRYQRLSGALVATEEGGGALGNAAGGVIAGALSYAAALAGQALLQGVAAALALSLRRPAATASDQQAPGTALVLEPGLGRDPQPGIGREPEPSPARDPEPAPARDPQPCPARDLEPPAAREPQPGSALDPGPATGGPTGATPPRASARSALAAAFSPRARALTGYYAAYSVFATCAGLWLQLALADKGLAPAGVGLSLAVCGMVSAAGGLVGGRLRGHFVFWLVPVVQALSALLLATLGNPWLAAAAVLPSALAGGVLYPRMDALVQATLPEHSRAAGLSVQSALFSAGMIAAFPGFGALLGHAGPLAYAAFVPAWGGLAWAGGLLGQTGRLPAAAVAAPES